MRELSCNMSTNIILWSASTTPPSDGPDKARKTNPPLPQSCPSYSRCYGAGDIGMALHLQTECPLPRPTCGLDQGPTPVTLIPSLNSYFYFLTTVPLVHFECLILQNRAISLNTGQICAFKSLL